MLTKDGKAIGTKTAFKVRDKLITRINLSPTKAFSIGASGVVYERRLIKNYSGGLFSFMLAFPSDNT